MAQPGLCPVQLSSRHQVVAQCSGPESSWRMALLALDLLKDLEDPPVGQLQCSFLSSLGPSSATHKIQGSPRTWFCIFLSLHESWASPTPATLCPLDEYLPSLSPQPLPWWPRNKESTCSSGTTGDIVSIPELGLSLIHISEPTRPY